MTWRDDPSQLAVSDNVDIVVELVGGEDGPALAAVEAALAAGKHVVTANKAMIARHGGRLAAHWLKRTMARNWRLKRRSQAAFPF